MPEGLKSWIRIPIDLLPPWQSLSKALVVSTARNKTRRVPLLLIAVIRTHIHNPKNTTYQSPILPSLNLVLSPDFPSFWSESDD